VTIVHDLSVSTSVKPPIRENIQKPLLFIQSPTSEPLPIVRAYVEIKLLLVVRQ
jgi:hypothetical protein